ncbi:MAG TPA: DUF2971 domain-containing protein, partial [Candidatus Limnocylindria bacterium]|nr:DUF2971 domain-containing protein [Candidatus Limnocylindria bacterium]
VLKQMIADAEPFTAFLQDQLTQLGDQFGVLCLSTVSNSLLMWAHYAASHEGFLIEFSIEQPSFQELGKLVRISYSPTRPIYDPGKSKSTSYAYQVKGADWAYESEYRIVRFLHRCESEEKNGVKIFLCPFSAEAIKAIYLGHRITKTNRERILAIARMHSLRVFETWLSRTHFVLGFREIRSAETSNTV